MNIPTTYRLKNGLIVDGSGSPAYSGDLWISGKTISLTEPDSATSHTEVIDCTNKVIAPGFIDVHSHMDYFAVKDKPESFAPFTGQGITTLITGNCGFSPFGFECQSPSHHLIENSLFKAGHDEIYWSNFNEYKQHINQHGLRQNLLSLAGHGVCRTSLRGFSPEPLGKNNLADMLALLDESMAQGAAGVSLGLQYKPGVFADMDELRAVARLVKQHNKILTVHAKAYSVLSGTYPMNPFGQAHNLRAIEEMLTLAKDTGVKLQFSHLIFVGKKTWPTQQKALAMFDKAIAEGLDVKFDIFPYTCGATLLNTLLPEWVMARMPDILHKSFPMLRLKFEAFLALKAVGLGYDAIQISDACCAEYQPYNGWYVADIAKQTKQSSFSVLLNILIKSNAEARMLLHHYNDPATIPALMKHPASLLMTDAWPEPSGIDNPATYGSFPRFLQIARESKCLTLEALVAKMTSQAAERFQLKKRGLLQQGYPADIVVFDWESVGDNPSSIQGDRKPTGIEHVFINGTAVLLEGKELQAPGTGDFLSAS